MNRRTPLLASAGLVLVLVAGLLLYRRSARTEAPGDIIIQAICGDSAPVASRPQRRANQRTSPAFDPARLPELVRDTSWEVRLTATDAVAASKHIPEGRRAELVLDALGQEISRPASAPPIAGSYLAPTGVFRLRYVHLIEDIGAAARDPARNAMQRGSGVHREWATIAWGASGAKEAGPALRELLRSSNQADVRMSAAHFLGRLGDRSAIGDLRAALRDPATARVGIDDTGDRGRTIYLVREQAAGALMALGIKVERNGHTFTAQ
jgi:HEAT repeat protein